MTTITIVAIQGENLVDILEKRLQEQYRIRKVWLHSPKQALNEAKKVRAGAKKGDKIITISGKLNHLIGIFLCRIPRRLERIAMIYDFSHFYPRSKDITGKIKHLISKKIEKKILIKADKIIHKGLEEELKYLPFYKRIRKKPEHLFREFIDKDDIIKKKDMLPKLSTKDGEIHLVYAGGLFIKDAPDSESFWNFYNKITKQKIHLHIYTKQPKIIIEKFKQIEKKDKYFHYEGFIKYDKLVKTISQYDWGVSLFGKIMNYEIPLIAKVGFSNKIFNYFAARIPIICNIETIANSQFVNQNNIGTVIKYKDINKLKNILKTKRYFNKDVIKTIEANKRKLITFLGEI